jgi:proline iminopeptidase
LRRPLHRAQASSSNPQREPIVQLNVAPRTEGFTTSTPVPLYWVEYGDRAAPPVLLLHGGPGASHDYLLPQMLELAREHRLVLYDQRGGGS